MLDQGNCERYKTSWLERFRHERDCMPALEIKVRAGHKSKAFKRHGEMLTIGRASHCDLVLPLSWLCEEHLIIENTGHALRVRTGSADAVAMVGTSPVGGQWMAVPSPATITVPTPKGGELVIHLTCVDSELETAILLDSSPASASDEAAIPVVSGDRLAGRGGWMPKKDGGASAQPQASAGDAHAAGPSMPAVPATPDDGRIRILGMSASLAAVVVGLFFVLLVGGALGFNRYRTYVEKKRLADDVAFVNGQIQAAQDLVGKKQYVAAKAALDEAEAVARRRPTLAEALGQITQFQQKPEIKLGGMGYIQMDGQWLEPEKAKAWQAARERDDPKIDQLEKKATEALTAKKYDDARIACEEAIGLMDAQPVKPHPKHAAFAAQLKSIADQSLAAEMTAKGLVLHEGKWVSKEEKIRLEQQAKGLVEYQGVWMTPEQMAEAQKKGGTGRVFYNGKWVTYEEKMAAEGYVLFEGAWLKSDQRDQILKKRAEDAQREQARLAAEKAAEEKRKADEIKAASLRKSAFEAAVKFIRKQERAAATLKFPGLDEPGVDVVYDEGWFIVRVAADAGTSGKKTFYCKLRPGTGDNWEMGVTLTADFFGAGLPSIRR